MNNIILAEELNPIGFFLQDSMEAIYVGVHHSNKKDVKSCGRITDPTLIPDTPTAIFARGEY